MNNANKDESEHVSYRKKYKKSLQKYIAMMLMADIFELDKSSKELLFNILDERPLEDYEWNRIIKQDRCIRSIFSEHPFYRFCDEYPAALVAASGKIKIMSN